MIGLTLGRYLKMEISERLLWFRKSCGKKLREVSADTGLSVGYISDVERGRTSPSLKTCKIFADYYEVTLSILFSGVNEQPKQKHA